MAPNTSNVKEFPDISSKLTAPARKSVFERQRAEAEAKRQREEAENAAALDDFVKSFEGGDDDGANNNDGGSGMGSGFRGGMRGGRGGGGFRGMARGHAPTGPGNLSSGVGSGGPMGRSGPGTLGPAPPPMLRKRAFDGSTPVRKEKEVGLFAFENSGVGMLDTAKAFQTSDDEDEKGHGGGEHGGATSEERAAEKAAPKPTLHLSSLPPGTSAALVKSLIPPSLTVDSVRMVPHVTDGSTERRSLSAIVTLAKDTPASDIDSAVSTLQNRYLGWGFYLSLSRHLSSAALGAMGSGSTSLNSLSSSLPFGAKTMPTPEKRGFAPPPSYGGMGHGQYGQARATTRVLVNPPSDIKQLKLIHKTIESLITHGPEFEALLMSRAEVQRGERWAWLWDARSAGGVWYRWKLWEIMTDCKTSLPRGGHLTPSSVKFPFTDGPGWFPPEKPLRFEYTTSFHDFASDADYDSSDEEDAEDEVQARTSNNNKNMTLAEALGESTGKSYMNPLQKAKFTHLLSRLPKTTARLRKGDVARVTAFAIKHAGEGADEVVKMIVANVDRPFAWADTKAEQDRDKDKMEQDEEVEKQYEKEDPSSSKLIALYLISDILSSSSTSGVRHAWKYRQLFETVLKQNRTFEGLGRLEKVYEWGRLRAEKWKRSVNGILSLWESWCVFPQAAHEHFVEAFMNPPLTEAEKKAAARQNDDEAQVAATAVPAPSSSSGAASKSKWKTVDEKAAEASRSAVTTAGAGAGAGAGASENSEMEEDEDVDGEPMADADLDGEPMEDVDGEPMQEDDVDGAPMDADPVQERDVERPQQPQQLRQQLLPKANQPPMMKMDPVLAKRQRPRAVDMFADSDEE